MNGKPKRRRILFRDDLRERLKDPEFRRGFDEIDAEVRLAVAIAEAREKEGLTQAELARKLHTRQSNISRIERGSQNLTIGTLRKIARALRCRISIQLLPA
ncbi:MAG: helix-turn-helix transcriptional regulator [Elusimicrobiota bacterium]|jgi:ribosome-binding protein aMBF1 (putative translation factor)